MGVVVASVPANHVYVRHLSVPGDGVRRLPDPRPRADVPDAQWWPPRMLEPGWVREHAEEFDVLHVHFGFDALAPEQLQEVVASLREAGKPLVVTVHDLRNPHHAEPGLHDEQLSVLVLAADAVITLTPGAADEIARRWGRRRHGAAAPARGGGAAAVAGAAGPRRVRRRRPRQEPARQHGPGAGRRRPRRRARRHARRPAARGRPHRRDDQQVSRGTSATFSAHLRDLDREGRIDLHVHDYFSDDELWDYLQGLDVSVLPYLFGTHSGWLEACYDLGTVVVAPDCGYYAEQRPCLTYTAEGNRDAAGGVGAAGRPQRLRRPPRLARRSRRAPDRTPRCWPGSTAPSTTGCSVGTGSPS